MRQFIWNLFNKDRINHVKETTKVGDVFMDDMLKEWEVLAVGSEVARIRYTFVWGFYETAVAWGVLARFMDKVDPAESVEEAMRSKV